jgi:hypothetical protein
MTEFSVTTIDFHGTTLLAIGGKTPGETLVAMKPVVEGMGLDWKSQHAKLASHPVLSKAMVLVTIPWEGKGQPMTAVPLTRLSFWLATIQPKRIPDEDVRSAVIAYQEKCADVLFEHFFGKVIQKTSRSDMTDDAKLRLVREARQTHGTAAARKLWFELGLPVVPEMVKNPRHADFTVDLNRGAPPAAATVN